MAAKQITLALMGEVFGTSGKACNAVHCSLAHYSTGEGMGIQGTK